MAVKIFNGYWTPYDARTHYDYIFIYGDNDASMEKGGQAIIRDEPNAYGIPTKKYPSYDKLSYYYDNELDDNKLKIDNAINKIIKKLKDKNSNYKGIILPSDGLGTGLAKLNTNAPLTFEYLNKKINELKLTCTQIFN